MSGSKGFCTIAALKHFSGNLEPYKNIIQKRRAYRIPSLTVV
jgi:hypothetical protein